MDDRNQLIQQILHHITHIETELTLVRTLLAHLVRNHDGLDQDLILVDAELIVPEEAVAPPPLELEQDPQDPRGIVLDEPRAPTRREILQDSRWRAQNWAIREQEERDRRVAQQNRD
jgi:hypothetical protein